MDKRNLSTQTVFAILLFFILVKLINVDKLFRIIIFLILLNIMVTFYWLFNFNVNNGNRVLNIRGLNDFIFQISDFFNNEITNRKMLNCEYLKVLLT